MEISSSKLKVKIKSKGAELSAISSSSTGINYLWSANPKFWARHSPVLFPVVGQLKNNSYVFNGKTFKLSRHGFARDSEFECIDHDAGSATFQLTENPESLEVYPFPFRLRISYRVRENELTVGYEVFNTGREPLPFSIGAHPAFCCPLQPNEKFEDYLIRFQHPETTNLHRLQQGLFSGVEELALENQREFPLRGSLFEKDALVFKHLKSEWVELRSKKSGHFVRLAFSEFPFLGIWTLPKAPFVCLEPWHGLADRVDATGYFLDKEGLQVALPQQGFEASYRLTFG